MTKWKRMNGSSSGGAVYGIGMVGAAFYFLQHASNFGEGVLAIIKAIVWPGIVVYHILSFLKLS